MSAWSVPAPDAPLHRAAASTVAGLALAPFGVPLAANFRQTGAVHEATLTIEDDADVPQGTVLLRPGAQHKVLVRLSRFPLPTSDPDVLTVTIKVPDAYGPGRDQDLLLATSGDGAPLHHLLLPAPRVGSRLYSSLWLYLAGSRPILFGLLPDPNGGRLEEEGLEGLSLRFAIAGPVTRFAAVGHLHLGQRLPDGEAALVSCAGANDGGGLRALPPVTSYREKAVTP